MNSKVKCQRCHDHHFICPVSGIGSCNDGKHLKDDHGWSECPDCTAKTPIQEMPDEAIEEAVKPIAESVVSDFKNKKDLIP